MRFDRSISGLVSRPRPRRRFARIVEICEARRLLAGVLPSMFLINDAPPVTRPSSGVTDAVFTVSIASANIEQTFYVDYTTTDGTASAANGDYTATSGELVFPYYESTLSQTISVPIPADAESLPVQNFSVVLSLPLDGNGEPQNAELTRKSGVGTILNPNASTPGQVQFSASSYQVGELGGSATIGLTRSPAPGLQFFSGPTTVAVAITGGTAVAGMDYTTPTSNLVSFGARQTTASFSIPILVNPLSISNKTIDFTLYDPTNGAVLGSPSTTVLTIINVNPLIVTNTNDCGLGSLRQAITTADTLPYAPTITFDIPGSGTHTIIPGSALPAITRPMTIDATTQPGYSGSPLIELSGTGLPNPTDALTVAGGSTTIEGFDINDFSGSAIVLDGEGNNLIRSNDLGTDPSGTVALPNGADGVFVNGSPSNTISGNLISGNAIAGVVILGGSATGNTVYANTIGLDQSGQKSVGNILDGVYVFQAPGNTVENNFIAGNGSVGIQIQGSVATENVIIGNRIGTNAPGTASVPNGADGVFINQAPGNKIELNLISGNGVDGVQILGNSASGNTVFSNLIGLDASGLVAIPNGLDGIFLNEAPNNAIQSNVISGNLSVGLQILGTGASGNSVQANAIGLDTYGRASGVGNGYGVFINGAPGYRASAGVLGKANRIAGNRVAQVFQTTTTTTVPPAKSTKTSAIRSVKAFRKGR